MKAERKEAVVQAEIRQDNPVQLATESILRSYNRLL